MSMLYVAVAVSAIVGGTKALRDSQTAQIQLEANAKANEFNAAVLRQRADDTYAAFGAREAQQRRTARLESAKRSAAAAESGLGTSGTMVDFNEQQDLFAEIDALNIRYEGDLEARGLLAQSELEAWTGRTNRQNSRNVRNARNFNVASAALSSAIGTYLGGGGKFT